MHPIKTLRNMFKRKVVDLTFSGLDLNNVGWKSIGGSSAFDFYKRNDMENGYASIRVIANNFAKIEEYTIDGKGKSVPCNILDRLYTPNTEMSAYEFREALAVTTLVHNKVHLEVVHSGNKPTANNIKGFLFMEGEIEHIIDGKRKYRLADGRELTDDTVITLLNINPYDLKAGFSPAMAARRWTKLDDYIADYQAGFFENGAVPSGQIVITAKTVQDFNDIVDKLESRHKGAGHNNNVTYTHRPTDESGKALNAQVEWQPFATANNNMALAELFDEVNKKIDSSYGVPASLRGVNDNNTYASVKVDQQILIENAIEPMIMKVWGKFTHELNRITGGIGVAITADVTIPQIADEELVKANAKAVQMTIFNTMIDRGYEKKSIVKAFELPESYNELKELPPPKVVEPVIPPTEENNQGSDTSSEEDPEVLEEDELKPEDKVESKKSIKKELSPVDKELYIEHYEKLVHKQMVKQVDEAIQRLPEIIKSKAIGDTTAIADKEFVDSVILLMTPLISMYGQQATNLGIKLILEAGLSTEYVDSFKMTMAQKKAYQKYVSKVATGYADITAEEIRNILGRGITEGWNVSQISDKLRATILGPESDYRVKRISRTEVNLAEGKSSLYAMENIAEETGYKVYKVWYAGGANPCEFCQAMNGTKIPVDSNFIDLDHHFMGVDGGELINDFKPTDTADMHPNCECVMTFRIERA